MDLGNQIRIDFNLGIWGRNTDIPLKIGAALQYSVKVLGLPLFHTVGCTFREFCGKNVIIGEMADVDRFSVISPTGFGNSSATVGFVNRLWVQHNYSV